MNMNVGHKKKPKKRIVHTAKQERYKDLFVNVEEKRNIMRK